MEKEMKATIVSLVMAGALGLSTVSCSLHKKENTSGETVTVRVERVNLQQGIRRAGYVGTVAPLKSVVLSCRYPGTLAQVFVKQGDYVEKGQVLAQVQAASVKSSYDMARTTFEQAEDGYKRVMQVHGTGSVPEIKKVEVESQYKKSKAAFEAAKQALDDCTIKAPYAGIIGEVYSDEGVELSITDPVMRLLDISEVEIRFPVPEKEIGRIQPGDTAFFVIPAMEDSLCAGRVKTKGMVASALSHSYTCTLKPMKNIEGLLPGMVCKVYLYSELRTGIVIPSSVVQMDTEGKYVWVVENQHASKRYVEIGGFHGKGVIVVSGLQDGDFVVVEGSRKISTGMEVKTVE